MRCIILLGVICCNRSQGKHTSIPKGGGVRRSYLPNAPFKPSRCTKTWDTIYTHYCHLFLPQVQRNDRKQKELQSVQKASLIKNDDIPRHLQSGSSCPGPMQQNTTHTHTHKKTHFPRVTRDNDNGPVSGEEKHNFRKTKRLPRNVNIALAIVAAAAARPEIPSTIRKI